MTEASVSSPGLTRCARCGSDGPWTRQREPFGLTGWCDDCWLFQRKAAWRLYRRARSAGTLILAGLCRRCHERPACTGHHWDYRKPFAVLWLCFRCHMREHKAERARYS